MQRLLAFATRAPAQLDTVAASLELRSGVRLGPDSVVVTYATRGSSCGHASGDVLQVQFVGPAAARRVTYAGLAPC